MTTFLKRRVIVMAEDDPDDQVLVTDAFAEAGLEADLKFVENGEQLLDYLGQRSNPQPALILLDLNLPKKDGREALREIKANPDLRRIPVVVLTTSKAETDIDCIYDLGANSFIRKPVNFDALVQIMKLLAQYWLGVVQLAAPKPPSP